MYGSYCYVAVWKVFVSVRGGCPAAAWLCAMLYYQTWEVHVGQSAYSCTINDLGGIG